MPDAVTHPTTQELAAFGLGKLPEQAVAAIAAHLESCPACRQAVASVTADSFLNKIRDASPGGSSFPPNPRRQVNAPRDAGQPATPAPLCPDLPPELAQHPKYRILRELGRGGMGVVYQARQTGMMDRPVVIKVISRSLIDNPDALERFLREVQAAGQLSHPNIVTAYDAEKAGDLHMLVMEFVPGQNLAELLDKKGPFPVVYACHFARQVALGLQHAHERGMVHRDIKPQNLILSLKNHVKILDFGLAKIVSERYESKGLTSSNACMGTAEYMSPEQAKDSRSADIRADLYSLGCTLYCLLAGRPPYREDTWMKTVLAHMEKQPQPLTELRSDVPESLWRVVARLLAKEPEQRYQKPQEVVQALAPFVKPGTKPEAKGVLAPASGVSTPARGTMLAADTNQIKKVLREVPGMTPPKEVPGRDEASPFADLTDEGVAPKKVGRVRKAAISSRMAWWKRPGVIAVAISVSLALILMAVIIIKIKVPPPKNGTGKPNLPPAEAIIVLEIDQTGAEVRIDGQKITVNVPGDNDPIEIKVEPGWHKLRISKAGFEAVTKDIELKTGKSNPIKIRLVREKAKRNAGGDDKWIKEVAGLPATMQVKAVADKLKERNPGFDGEVKPTIENGVVTGLWFLTDQITDLSPLRALPQLKSLSCAGSAPGKGILADLSPLKGIHLTGLNCSFNNRISDLSPLKDMQLTSLSCRFASVSDLSPLKEMKLTLLDFEWTRVSDLSSLKGIKLTSLDCGGTVVSDLSPLKGMQLKNLNLGDTRVLDLSPLKGMPLTSLGCNDTQVSDLSPLKGMKLASLQCGNTRVSDLSPLKGMKLTWLGYKGTQVSDLSPLKEMPLKEVYCDFRPERDAEILRSIKTLEKINGKPLAEVLKLPAEPQDEKWIREVTVLSAEERVKTVAAKLKELNPGFDGEVKPTIEDGCVTGLEFVTDHVTDLSPLRALPRLTRLSCEGSGQNNAGQNNGRLANLSPLKGMHLTELNCCGNNRISDILPLKGMQLTRLSCIGTSVSDLSPLKGMPLATLYCGFAQVSDLSPLKGMRLTVFGCAKTHVRDLSPLKGMKLRTLICFGTAISDLSPLKGIPLVELDCQNTRVFDLSPLKGMPLKTLSCDIRSERNRKILRSIKTLENINGKPAAQFWKELGGTNTFSGSPTKEKGPSRDKGFVSLFNGKDLSGWKTHTTLPNNWRVEKGVLLNSGFGGNFGLARGGLYSERSDYKDFILRIELRVSEELIGGVHFRAPSDGAAGYRAFIDCTDTPTSDDSRKTGGLGPGQHHPILVPNDHSPVRSGDWFRMEIIAKGSHLVIKVNDKTTADYEDRDRLYTSGHILLCKFEKGVIEIRKVEIKELPARKP